MKNLNLFLSGLMCLFLITSSAFSQGDIYIHFGPSFPMEDFADEEEAGVGLGLGFQYTYPITESGLGMFIGIDFAYNGLNQDMKEDIEEETGLDDDDITFSKFLNFPVSAGLNYTLNADSNIALIANAGLTGNFLKITDLVFETPTGDVTVKYDLSSGFGYKLGAGVLINKKTSIEINYFGLGDYDIDAEGEIPGEAMQEFEAETEIDILLITIGFLLE